MTDDPPDAPPPRRAAQRAGRRVQYIVPTRNTASNSWLFAAVLASVGCAAPAPRVSGPTAELATVIPYARALALECDSPGPSLSTVIHIPGESKVLIMTDPPQREVSWRVEACGRGLEFVLDCSEAEQDDERCYPHTWPMPAELAVGPARRLAAALTVAPPCLRKGAAELASDRRVTISPLTSARDWWNSKLEVRRCGGRRVVEVSCSEERCAARALTETLFGEGACVSCAGVEQGARERWAD
ncbi:MAG: hypothetical protein H6718_13790 [Polyangiaceae bacterium]|nr:hypothetical protein [Polyangiaceae bacterium]MCB9605976.1 hypothetical protein [Polyangiaceae bacterium]